MRSVAIRGIGICAGGLPDWASATRVFEGTDSFDPRNTSTAAPAGLPPTERRRVNEMSRLSCLAARDALTGAHPDVAASIPTIFVSSDGDGAVLAQMLRALAQREVFISPTVFHNSVYNAPAGYWSIATRSTAPSTTLCAGEASIAAGFLEAYAQAQVTGGPILLVAADMPFPQEVRALGSSAAPFAFAMQVEVAQGGALPRLERIAVNAADGHPDDPADPLALAFAGNATAKVLPLLRALARGERTRATLPYFDGFRLELDVLPK